MTGKKKNRPKAPTHYTSSTMTTSQRNTGKKSHTKKLCAQYAPPKKDPNRTHITIYSNSIKYTGNVGPKTASFDFSNLQSTASSRTRGPNTSPLTSSTFTCKLYWTALNMSKSISLTYYNNHWWIQRSQTRAQWLGLLQNSLWYLWPITIRNPGQ